MPKILSRGAAAAMIILLFTVHAVAQPENEQAKEKPKESVAELEAQSREAYQEKNWVRVYMTNMKLHQQRPFVPEYMLNIALSAASLDQKNTAYHYMLQMQQQGLAYDFDQYPESENIRGTQAYDYINELMVKASDPMGEGEKVLSLDLAPGDLGDMVWDPARGRFLVGTRSEGKLLAVDDEGKVELLMTADEENGLWSIDGLAVDSERQRLWIASSATPAFTKFTPADAHRGGLFEFDLETLEKINHYALPVDALQHALGSIAMTKDGDIYVIDRATPIVFRKSATGTKLEAFAGGPHLVALTDIAVTPDNSRVFIADAVMGILLIDPQAHRAAMLSGPENLNLSGIYNIEFTDNTLVITQSGISPQRIVRLELNADGAQVDTVSPMASSLDGFDWPGVGVLRDESLYYFANHGSQNADELLMMATPLDAGSAVKPPDLRQFEDMLRRSQQQGKVQQ